MSQPTGESSLCELRHLLLSGPRPELEAVDARLAVLERHMLDREVRRSAVGEVLPDALRDRGDTGPELQLALRPEVERAIHESVREEPTIIAEAIYPVMGPVIRRIVRRLFEGETTTSSRPYQVEQLFLIHRGSGLVVAHSTAAGIVSRDADMISGMLDAIRSFVQDAFDTHDVDGLQAMTVGDVNVRIEWSPAVVLAAVVRGIEPPSLQPALERTLAGLHERHGPALERFDGDSTPFEGLSLHLDETLDATTATPAEEPARLWLKPVVTTALLLALVALFARWQESRDWQRAIAQLGDAPGVVVTDHRRGWRRDTIHGLRDPDAVDPRSIVVAEGIDGHRLDGRWEGYLSDDPRIKVRRAVRVLAPPDGVELNVVGRELQVSGAVPTAWLESARAVAPTIDGIDSVRQGVSTNDAGGLQR